MKRTGKGAPAFILGRMADSQTQRFYYPELDGLRFFAFLLVFIHNAPYLESSRIWTALHEYGWIGVDLFFCLSAFLITKLLVLEHQQTQAINIRYFYIRRTLRIWPLYFFYLVFATLFIVQDQGWNNDILKHGAGLLTFTYNFAYLLLNEKIFFVFVHLWTISYEEQFYFIIPLVLRSFMSKTKTVKLTALLLIYAIGVLIRGGFIYFHIEHPAIYMLPFTHFDAMICGIAMGAGVFDNIINKIHSGFLLTLGSLFMIGVFLLPNTYVTSWKLMLTYPLSGFGAALIISAFIFKESKTSRILRNKMLVYFGKISYGLYIFHIISISIANEVFTRILGMLPSAISDYPALLVIFGFLLTLIFSVLSFHYLEKPFTNIKENYKAIPAQR
ncbi:MAG: acyltransferase [Chloroflexi bacterium]|nr:acyltransferase [Chloroflexota bacterium]